MLHDVLSVAGVPVISGVPAVSGLPAAGVPAVGCVSHLLSSLLLLASLFADM